MTGNSVKLIPLGGLGEIGKNMLALEYGENILVVDSGLMFPENDMLGVDYIIPDFRYLIENSSKVRAIVVTHGHEDHTGAIQHVVEKIDAPIYATRLTCGLLEVKLQRANLEKSVSLNEVQAGGLIEVGPFKIEFFHVTHSIPDAVGLGITTPAGLIVHSGDYKFDHTPIDGWPTDLRKLAEFGGREVLALLADSTNSDKPGWTPSASVIDAALEEVFRSAPGRILVGTFASLISRMAQVGRAAAAHGRVMAFVGRSMIDNAEMARSLGYLDLPQDLIVPLDRALRMKPSQVVLMCTGTQGEPSSILGRLSTGTNRQFDLNPQDTVVLSSHAIPGNEVTVYRTINRLLQRGAEVIHEAIAPVHVSGHASQEEMKLLLQLVRPKHLIPIHGELRHLKQHASLARQVGIPDDRIAVVENGTLIEFRSGEMHVGERIPGGYVFVDGSKVGDVGPTVMRQREILSRDGFVAVHVSLDARNGSLADEPEIHSRGFVYMPEAEDLFELARRHIRELLPTIEDPIEPRLEKELGRFFFSQTGRHPVVLVFASRIPSLASE